jgi:hypothetical protein
VRSGEDWSVDVGDGQRDYTAGRPSRRAWLRDQQVKLGAGVAALLMVTAGIALAQAGNDPPATVVAGSTTTTTAPTSSILASTTTGRPPFRGPTTTSLTEGATPTAAPTTASTGPPVGPSIGPPIGPPAVAAPAPTPAPATAPAPPAAPAPPPSRPGKPPRPAPEPADRDLAKVKVSIDKRHGHLDTFPRFCDTPRVWVKNPTSRWVTSLRVRFKTVVTRYGKRSMGLARGPVVRTGPRVVRVPPWHTRSVPLRVCAGPWVLPKKPKNPPGAYLPEPRLLAKHVVRFRVTLG